MHCHKLAVRPVGGQYKIGGVKEIKRPAGKPFDRWQRAVKPVPKPYHRTFTQWRRMERQRRPLAFCRRHRPNNKEAYLICRLKR